MRLTTSAARRSEPSWSPWSTVTPPARMPSLGASKARAEASAMESAPPGQATRTSGGAGPPPAAGRPRDPGGGDEAADQLGDVGGGERGDGLGEAEAGGASLGAGGGSSAASLASPGTIAGDLDRRAGDFVATGGRRGGGGGTLFGASAKGLIGMAKGNGRAQDPSIRQKLMQLHAIGEVARYNNLRLKAAMAAGKDIPGLPNIAKLLMSQTVRLSRDLGLEICGGYGTLHAYDPHDRKALDAATGMPSLSGITEMALFAQGPPIYGGTDQVQRNIIGERVLGLPKEPGFDKATPFKDLPKNG